MLKEVNGEIKSMSDQIQFITVIPQNQFFFHFFINDSEEFHSKTLKEGEDYLKAFLPIKKRLYLNELLYSFIPFVLDIENGDLIELSLDKAKELRLLKKQLKNEVPSIEKEKSKETIYSFDNLRYTDGILDKISKLNRKE